MHERGKKHARQKVYARGKHEIQGKPETEEVCKIGGESERVSKRKCKADKGQEKERKAHVRYVMCRGKCRQNRKTGKGERESMMRQTESTCDKAHDRERVNVPKRKKTREKDRKSASM